MHISTTHDEKFGEDILPLFLKTSLNLYEKIPVGAPTIQKGAEIPACSYRSYFK